MNTKKSRLASERRKALNTANPFDYFSAYNAGFIAGRIEGKNEGFTEGMEAMRKIADETMKEVFS